MLVLFNIHHYHVKAENTCIDFCLIIEFYENSIQIFLSGNIS